MVFSKLGYVALVYVQCTALFYRIYSTKTNNIMVMYVDDSLGDAGGFTGFQ